MTIRTIRTARAASTFVMAALLGLGALPAGARDLSGEFSVSPAAPGDGYLPAAAMDARGEVIVAWAQGGDGILARRFGRDGTPRGDGFQVGEQGRSYLGPIEAALDTQGFSVVWGESSNHSGSASFLRRFGPAGGPLTGAISLSADFSVGSPSVGTDGRGNSVAVWPNQTGRVLGRRFDAQGRPAGPAFEVTPGPSFNVKVAVAGNGSFVAVWMDARGGGGGAYGRRFDAAAKPLGSVFLVAATASNIALAGNAQGAFAASWTSSRGIQARASGPAGLRNAVLVTSQKPASRSSIAMDAAGRFLVTWTCCQDIRPATTFGRFFNASGAPLDRSFPISLRNGTMDTQPSAAAGPAGDFLVVWQQLSETEGGGIVGRFLDGSPDLDIAFGQPGDAPLLGDIDGEGRADPCVRRGAQILCDTAHNGGTAEVVVTFGAAGSPVLLGDVDGDGDDDPCLPGGGRLSCDTEHDGGAAELQIPLATQAGDVPLLADVDGDGRADPCVFRGGRFLCDPRRSGALKPFGLPFTAEPGAVPLLGNVNGL